MHKDVSDQSIPEKKEPQRYECETDRSMPIDGRQDRPQYQQLSRSRRSNLKAGVAIAAGRTAGAVSRRFHLGGGTSIVGVVAQRLYPAIIQHLASQLTHGSVLITGTNGKTTTSSFLTSILKNGTLRVWRNREGSNLVGGIASSLVIRAYPHGRLKRSGKAIAVFEVDEAALPQVAQMVSPRVALFTNLFRDQLDRYGEVDSVLEYWKRAIRSFPPSTTLVLNADDPATAQLGASFPGPKRYYGIANHSLPETERHQVLDARTCPSCGSDYTYSVHFYSHMGHYFCSTCGSKRPQPDVQATDIQKDNFNHWHLRVDVAGQTHEVTVPLPGLYNVYNALAAMTAAQTLNMDWTAIIGGIERFKPIFGRGELIEVEGKTLCLLLAKNPTGFNEVLHMLFDDGHARHVLLVLNDNIADGRDISWIWDVDYEVVAGKTETVVITGTRALDLALRLKLSGIAEHQMHIIPSIALRAAKKTDTGVHANHDAPQQTETERYGLKHALDTALHQTPVGETLFIIPTYTGLLEIHRLLEARGLVSRYWEGKDV